MVHLLVTVFCAIRVSYYHVAAATGNVLELWPNILVVDQTIYPNEPIVYALHLDAAQKYEIKLSYRATTPSFFKLRIFDSSSMQKSDILHNRRSMRRVLNTEKTFVTGVPGKVTYVEVV